MSVLSSLFMAENILCKSGVKNCIHNIFGKKSSIFLILLMVAKSYWFCWKFNTHVWKITYRDHKDIFCNSWTNWPLTTIEPFVNSLDVDETLNKVWQSVWHSDNIFTNFERHWITLKIEADKNLSRRHFSWWTEEII